MKKPITTLSFLLMVFSISAQSIQNGLLGYYPFNGNFKDSSSNGFHGTATNVVFVADRNGKPDKAASFNGISSKIVTSLTQKAVIEYTISAWVKVPDGAIEKTIMCNRGISGSGDGILLTDRALALDGDYALRGIQSKNPITGNWYHIAGTWKGVPGTEIDQKQMKLYINGKLEDVNIASAANSRTAPLNIDTAMIIGRHTGWNHWFNGNIDELRIYKRALSLNEINLLYKGLTIYLPEETKFLLSGSTININWEAADSITSVDLKYSTDSGTTWTNIATNVTNKPIPWTVPSIGTDSLIIRISNHANALQYYETQFMGVNDSELKYRLSCYYPLNGNANDASGKGNNAVSAYITDTVDNSNYPQRAMYFDSDTDRILASGLKTGKEGTISLWVRKNNWATTEDELVVGNKSGVGVSELYLNLHSGVGVHFRYGTWNTGTDRYLAYNTSRTWTSNSWHQIAIRWKHTEGTTYLSLFVDGNKVADQSTSLLIEENANWLFGEKNIGSSLKGSLDEIRIYNIALSDDLIYKVYEDGLPLKITQPVEGMDVVRNSQQQIKWHYPLGISNISIELSSDNSKTWSTIADNISVTTPSITWNVPSVTSDSCFFRISSPAYPGIYFKQNYRFRIVSDSSKLNLVYYLKLDGNSSDSSGLVNNGILHGATLVKGLKGKTNGAYTFNGLTNYLEMPASATTGLNNFTFSCWIKTTENRNSETYWQRPSIFGNSTPGSPDSDFGIVTNNGYLSIWSGLNSSGDNSTISKSFISDNEWHNVLCTYDGKIIQLYVDGKYINCSLTANQALNNHGYWIMAQHRYDGVPAYFHNGVIDEVKLYSKALDSTQIKDIFEKNKPMALLTPKIRQDIAGGSKVNVSWQKAIDIENSVITYSADTGKTWTEVVSPTSISNNNYEWTIPYIINDSALFKIVSLYKTGLKDTLVRYVRVVKDWSYVNLRVWYPFNILNNNTVKDSSGFKCDGIIHGATPVSINNSTDKAYYFDGINNSIEIAKMPQLQQFTLALWINTTSTSGYIYSMTHGGYIAINRSAGDKPGKIIASIENPAANYSELIDTVVISDGKWHFIVLTSGIDSFRLYVDNRNVSTKPVMGNIDYNATGALLGKYDENASFPFKGTIDDVRLYKNELDKENVKRLYSLGTQHKICINYPAFINAGEDVKICKGENVILTAGGNLTSYSWNNNVVNAQSFKPEATKRYTVSGSNSNGCSAKDSVLVTVSTPILYAGADTAICPKSDLILTATGNLESYTWNNSVFNGKPFRPTVSGNYIVTGKNIDGCSANDTVYVSIKTTCSSGINNLGSYDFSVAPNPSKGNIRIISQTGELIRNVKIINMQGAVIKETYDSDVEISFSNLPKGIFIAVISSDSGSIKKKIIVE